MTAPHLYDDEDDDEDLHGDAGDTAEALAAARAAHPAGKGMIKNDRGPRASECLAYQLVDADLTTGPDHRLGEPNSWRVECVLPVNSDGVHMLGSYPANLPHTDIAGNHFEPSGYWESR